MTNTRSLATAGLECHSQSLCTKVRSIQVSASRSEDGTLHLNFILEGELPKLSLPPPSPPEWCFGLWEHSCFEVFIRPMNGETYWEFNFSPSGAWAAFSFRSYRDGEAFSEGPPPTVETRRTEAQFELNAVLDPKLLPHASEETPLCLGCCAVIEDAEGTLSYWALRHPAEAPDFHHPDGFALKL